jgi:hypothetical protein
MTKLHSLHKDLRHKIVLRAVPCGTLGSATTARLSWLQVAYRGLRPSKLVEIRESRFKARRFLVSCSRKEKS